jgi:uncharacterized FlaG/YvyC family protein
MGQISATTLRAAPLPELHSNAAAQADRAKAKAIASAVKVLNEAGAAGADREVTYSTDAATKTLVIQVVDKRSGEVVVQWPSEYGLQMAQQFQKEHPDK